MTAEAQSFVAGILAELPALLAIGSPSVASYLRLVPSHWAGVYQVWGRENREAAVRLVTGIVGTRDTSSNCEVKTFDLSANPYLAIGALIAAGLAGLEQGCSFRPSSPTTPRIIPPRSSRSWACAGSRVTERGRRAPGEVRRPARGDGQHPLRGVPGGAPRRDRGVRGPGPARPSPPRTAGGTEGSPVVPATQVLDALPLVDDHCHGVVREVADRAAFESHINEGFDAPPAGTSHFDTPNRARRPALVSPRCWVWSRTPRPRCTSSGAPSSGRGRSTGG